MAWLDDRAWCHPKVTQLSPTARWVWVASICYSSGFLTLGRLTPAQQRLVGSNEKVRRELVEADLWIEIDEYGNVEINNWEEHNDKRDAKRAADRERKRRERMSHGNGADSPRNVTRTKVGKSQAEE